MSEQSWPAAWPRRSVKLLVASAILGVLAGFVGIGVVQIWEQAGFETAAPYLMFIWLLLPLVAVGVAAQPHGPGRDVRRIRSVPIDRTDPASDDAVLVPTHPFWRMLSVWFVLPAVVTVVRGRRPSGLLLSRDGVGLETLFRRKFVPWEQVGAVVPYFWNLKGAQWQILLGTRPHQIPANMLAANPAVVLRAIEFYWKHADLRPELGTEAGVRRIRSGAFQSY